VGFSILYYDRFLEVKKELEHLLMQFVYKKIS